MSEVEQNKLILLIEKAKAGDEGAFDELYNFYFSPIYKYAYFRLKSKNEAEDLTQDVFLKAFKAISRYRQEKTSFLAYLLTIARNSIIDFWRKKRPTPLDSVNEAEFAETASQPEEQEQRERKEKIKRAMTNLSDDQYEIIALKFFSELSNAEIAKILNKSEEAVRQGQLRALKKLKENIEKND